MKNTAKKLVALALLISLSCSQLTLSRGGFGGGGRGGGGRVAAVDAVALVDQVALVLVARAAVAN